MGVFIIEKEEINASNQEAEREKKSKRKKRIPYGLRLLFKTIVLIAAIYVVTTYILQPYRMKGNTMSPFVRDGDLGFYYTLDDYYLNDVVLYEDAKGSLRVGRIIACPEQCVNFFENGGFEVDEYIPAEEIPYETYIAEENKDQFPLTLGSDEFFIMNDYRSSANDSRLYGGVSVDKIHGKLLILLRRRDF